MNDIIKKSLTREEREMLARLVSETNLLSELRPVMGADVCPFCGSQNVDIDGFAGYMPQLFCCGLCRSQSAARPCIVEHQKDVSETLDKMQNVEISLYYMAIFSTGFYLFCISRLLHSPCPLK